MTKVVIAGCGYVGTRLGEILVEGGNDVWGLRRAIPSAPSTIRWMSADLTDPGSLSNLDLACDFAVYCAAADGHSERAYHAAYVTGLAAFLDHLKECSPNLRRVLFTSSTGVYGQDDGSWVDEDSPTAPTRFSGQKVLEGERLLLSSGLPGIVLRFGGIYGPGRNGLRDRIKAGRAELSGTRSFTNRIHREDCARSIEHLLNLDDPQSIYNGVDNHPCDRNEAVAWLAEEIGVSLNPASTPVSGPDSGKRVKNDRLMKTGYRFVYPTYREGYTEMMREESGS